MKNCINAFRETIFVHFILNRKSIQLIRLKKKPPEFYDLNGVLFERSFGLKIYGKGKNTPRMFTAIKNFYLKTKNCIDE